MQEEERKIHYDERRQLDRETMASVREAESGNEINSQYSSQTEAATRHHRMFKGQQS